VLTVALAVLLLLHVPPLTLSVSVIVAPSHTLEDPDIVPATGSGLTVIMVVVAAAPQPFVIVYEMVTVPALTPVTSPAEFTEAMPVLLLLHVPPPTDAVSVADAASHTVPAPDIEPADGRGLTVMSDVATAVPHPSVTV
jgi:hypothetical protein